MSPEYKSSAQRLWAFLPYCVPEGVLGSHLGCLSTLDALPSSGLGRSAATLVCWVGLWCLFPGLLVELLFVPVSCSPLEDVNLKPNVYRIWGCRSCVLLCQVAGLLVWCFKGTYCFHLQGLETPQPLKMMEACSFKMSGISKPNYPAWQPRSLESLISMLWKPQTTHTQNL